MEGALLSDASASSQQMQKPDITTNISWNIVVKYTTVLNVDKKFNHMQFLALRIQIIKKNMQFI